MKKINLIIFSIVIISTLNGCSKQQDEIKKYKSNYYTSQNTFSSNITPFVLNEKTIISSPFASIDSSLIFPNPQDNNKISVIDDPYKKNIIKTSDTKDFFNHHTNSLTIVDDIIYFADASNFNNLSSLSLIDKTYNNINSNNVHNLVSSNKSLFYINANDNNKLYTYDIENKITKAISSDSIGSFIINGDFILYQNLSDNSKLYSIKTDSTQRECLSDFSVESFTIYEGYILTINSSDNNTLYIIDPSNLKHSRLNAITGSNLKSFENNIYFINSNDGNHLYNLYINVDTLEASIKPLLKESINNYYPSNNSIFIEKSLNINNIYVINIPIKEE